MKMRSYMENQKNLRHLSKAIKPGPRKWPKSPKLAMKGGCCFHLGYAQASQELGLALVYWSS